MRLCSGPGCGRAIPDGQRFCDECQKEQPAKPSRWERSKTDPIMKLFSNPRWQRFRRLVQQQYPMCNGCHSAPSAVADHRIPARLICRVAKELGLFPFDAWGGFYIRDNMQGLCHSCHNTKTKTEDGQDWTDELARVLGPYMSGTTEDECRARIVSVYGGRVA